MSNQGNPLEKNRLGPYKLLRRLRGVTTAAEVGKVYKAYQRKTGRPALVVRGVSPAHHTPSEEWRLRVRAGTGPHPYVALEMEHAPQGAAPVKQLDAGLRVLASALEGLERHPEAAAHLHAHRAPTPRRTPLAERAPFLLAGAAALLGLSLLAPRAWQPTQPADAVPTAEAQTAAADEALAEPQALPVAAAHPRAWRRIAIDMPKKPFPGQYKPEKNGTCKARTETPIKGGCWVELGLKPPCGDDAYEHAGKCYWPSMPAPRDPSSNVPRGAPVPAQPTQQ